MTTVKFDIELMLKFIEVVMKYFFRFYRYNAGNIKSNLNKLSPSGIKINSSDEHIIIYR